MLCLPACYSVSTAVAHAWVHGGQTAAARLAEHCCAQACAAGEPGEQLSRWTAAAGDAKAAQQQAYRSDLSKSRILADVLRTARQRQSMRHKGSGSGDLRRSPSLADLALQFGALEGASGEGADTPAATKARQQSPSPVSPAAAADPLGGSIRQEGALQQADAAPVGLVSGGRPASTGKPPRAPARRVSISARVQVQEVSQGSLGGCCAEHLRGSVLPAGYVGPAFRRKLCLQQGHHLTCLHARQRAESLHDLLLAVVVLLMRSTDRGQLLTGCLAV